LAISIHPVKTSNLSTMDSSLVYSWPVVTSRSGKPPERLLGHMGFYIDTQQVIHQFLPIYLMGRNGCAFFSAILQLIRMAVLAEINAAGFCQCLSQLQLRQGG
jgi:hypothetical protein